VFDGTDYDAYQATLGVITLRDCTLVGNKTSGTITTDATLRTEGVDASGTVSANLLTPDAADGADIGTDALEFSDVYLADSSIIKFGNSQDVTMTHVDDAGLNLKQVTDADDNPFILVLQTGETDMATDDVLGGIYFQAPDEAATGDAQLVAAGIEAVSEGDFAADNNATKLSFQTGASETAAEKMALSSAGVLTTTSDVELGHATDTTIARSAAGAVTIEGKQIVLTGVAAGREFSVHNESHGEAQEDITEAQILASKFFTNQGSAGETDSRLPAVSYYISITLIVNEAQIWEIEPPDTEAFDLNGTVLAADDVIDSPTGIGAKIVLTRMLLADGTTWRWSADTVRGVWVDGDAED